jgi:hypothetical protein
LSVIGLVGGVFRVNVSGRGTVIPSTVHQNQHDPNRLTNNIDLQITNYLQHGQKKNLVSLCNFYILSLNNYGFTDLMYYGISFIYRN